MSNFDDNPSIKDNPLLRLKMKVLCEKRNYGINSDAKCIYSINK